MAITQRYAGKYADIIIVIATIKGENGYFYQNI